MSLSSLEIRSFCAEDPNLHPRHYAILDLIASFERSGNRCYASQSRIAEMVGCHVRTVGNHIKAAVLSDFLLVTGSQSTNTYRINPDYKESHSVKFTARIGNKYRQYKKDIEVVKDKVNKISKRVTGIKPAIRIGDLVDALSGKHENSVINKLNATALKAGWRHPEPVVGSFLLYNYDENGPDYSVSVSQLCKMFIGYVNKRADMGHNNPESPYAF